MTARPPFDATHPDVDERRFLVVTGKGGVGKTTVAAAQALALAERGKRVLVCMCNAKERMSTMFGHPDPIGAEVVSVATNVWAVNMDPARALEEYGALILKSRALYKLIFDNRYVRTFFRAIPGIQEWTMLGKAWWHTTETLEDGRPRFDTVILDAPATGHGLDMLRVPKIIVDVVPPGILRRDAERAWEMFKDPQKRGIVLVTLPEEMPTTETIELATALRSELELPIGRVVVNGLLPRLFSDVENAKLSSLAAKTPANVDEAAVASGRRRALREGIQSSALERLSAALAVPTVHLPLLFEEASSPSAIRELALRLAAG